MTSDEHTDILLVTVTKVEAMSVLNVFGGIGQQARPLSIDDRIYFDLGKVNDAQVRMTRSEMGTGGLSASLQSVGKGIAALSPVAVIMVGIAFGINEDHQSIGDILVSERLRPYDLQRVGTREDGQAQVILRDDKPHASSWLLNLLRSSELTWEGAAVRFGTVLTGAKLVDNLDFREQIHTFDPEAIGGEMEGAGLYVACHDQKVDWILVKGISDFANGKKAKDKDIRQSVAANNAAKFVYHALRFTKVDWGAHRGTSFRRNTLLDTLSSPANLVIDFREARWDYHNNAVFVSFAIANTGGRIATVDHIYIEILDIFPTSESESSWVGAVMQEFRFNVELCPPKMKYMIGENMTFVYKNGDIDGFKIKLTSVSRVFYSVITIINT